MESQCSKICGTKENFVLFVSKILVQKIQIPIKGLIKQTQLTWFLHSYSINVHSCCWFSPKQLVNVESAGGERSAPEDFHWETEANFSVDAKSKFHSQQIVSCPMESALVFQSPLRLHITNECLTLKNLFAQLTPGGDQQPYQIKMNVISLFVCFLPTLTLKK